MTDIQTPPPPRPRRWVKVLLAASLTANLAVVGLVAGAHIGDRRAHGFDPRGPERGMIRELGFGPLASALTREDRRAIGKALRAEKGSFKENRAAIRRDFEAMQGVLKADPFDPAALAALMQAQRARVGDVGEVLQRLVIARITQMTPEERRAFAQKISERVRFDKRKHGHR